MLTMTSHRKISSRAHRQAGMSLVEVLIATTISLVVSAAMLGLAANSLGAGGNTIKMARLTAELRTVMQIVTRETRRANFHGNFAKCFGNLDCVATLENGDSSASSVIKAITVGDAVGTDDCVFFWYDRDADGVVIGDDPIGAFRRAVVGGVGVIQMTMTRTSAPTCNSGNDWISLTNPSFVNVSAFTISNALSLSDLITGAGDSQRVEKIGFSITGNLVSDTAVEKTVQDLVRVRNDVFAAASP